MNDAFMEKIVQRRKTGKDYLTIVGLLVASFVLLTALMMFGGYISFLVPILLVGIFYGLWYLLTNMSREFEYIVTNGDLDIDMIIARRRRKRVFSGKAKDFEIMAKVNSDEYRDAQRGKQKLLDFSSSIQAPDNWFFITDYKGERCLVVFAPDERMLKSMKRFNPNKIKYVQYGA
ncbi:MAG: DUF6106 family protein [Eubacteriales bacterium]|nr:DUF6106 family protein [Eubacteriales bacterium]MDD4743382.1 DUF6106 family protein [Eubacteriales bacterium]